MVKHCTKLISTVIATRTYTYAHIGSQTICISGLT